MKKPKPNEPESVPTKIEKSQNSEENQIFWICIVVIAVFAIFFGAYYYFNDFSRFNHAGVKWTIEKYADPEDKDDVLKLYYTRFTSFQYPELNYNLWLRNDPRTNNVPVKGNLDEFKYGGFFSFTPEVDECRGDIVGSLMTFNDFLRNVVGMKELSSTGTTSWEVFKNDEEGRRIFADCSLSNRGVFIFQLGESHSIVQSEENPFCYTITLKNCNDIKPIEKFMIETIRTKMEG
jgi:hypothetical protein